MLNGSECIEILRWLSLKDECVISDDTVIPNDLQQFLIVLLGPITRRLESGLMRRQLPSLSFVPVDDLDSVSITDADVIRRAHGCDLARSGASLRWVRE